jgi:hypothetical protein
MRIIEGRPEQQSRFQTIIDVAVVSKCAMAAVVYASGLRRRGISVETFLSSNRNSQFKRAMKCAYEVHDLDAAPQCEGALA